MNKLLSQRSFKRTDVILVAVLEININLVISRVLLHSLKDFSNNFLTVLLKLTYIDSLVISYNILLYSLKVFVNNFLTNLS